MKSSVIRFSRLFDTREALLDAAISLASTIARKSPIAVQGSKVNLNYARDHTTEDSFNFIVRFPSSLFSWISFLVECLE